MSHSDTIVALSTPPGRSAIAVVRVSGAHAKEAYDMLGIPCPSPRLATRAKLKIEKETLDDALVLFFPGPASYTGEDVVEFHTHGGRAITRRLIEILLANDHFRLAEPGEFTRRAYLNGKMDLTEAEGVADLIDAETAAQQRQAVRLMGGAAKEFYDALRGRILKPLARIEAFIDFPDEEIPAEIVQTLTHDVSALARDIEKTLADGKRGERIRQGVEVAIVGAPNVGKSSLMNALAGRNVAIVSQHAGTTRDIIEVSLDLGGYAVTLADTAGLREAADEIESEGIRRAIKRAEEADITIALFDASVPASGRAEHGASREKKILARDKATAALVNEGTIVVASKADLAGNTEGMLKISTKTGEGIDALLEALKKKIDEELSSEAAPVITRARHRKALEVAHTCVQKFLERIKNPSDNIELAAEELRLAASAIGRITGAIGVEDLLDVIFQEFCIGK